MKRILFGLFAAAALAAAAVLAADATAPPLGLPPVPDPGRQPPDAREDRARRASSSTTSASARPAQVACATCHDAEEGLHRQPAADLGGHQEGRQGSPARATRRPSSNAAYFVSQFWDGRSPSLEDQSQHPFVNPVEMGLKDHQPILKIVRTDPAYVKAFEQVFGKKGAAGHDERGAAGDRRLRAHAGLRRLAVRPLLLRRRRDGPHRRSRSAASTSSSTRAAACPAT